MPALDLAILLAGSVKVNSSWATAAWLQHIKPIAMNRFIEIKNGLAQGQAAID